MDRSIKLNINKYKVLTLVFIFIVSGCASSSDLEKAAQNHAKAGDYYESIGQPNAAREERGEASKNRSEANGLFPFLVDVFDVFYKKGK